jgi:hypothetical protein
MNDDSDAESTLIIPEANPDAEINPDPNLPCEKQNMSELLKALDAELVDNEVAFEVDIVRNETRGILSKITHGDIRDLFKTDKEAERAKIRRILNQWRETIGNFKPSTYSWIKFRYVMEVAAAMEADTRLIDIGIIHNMIRLFHEYIERQQPWWQTHDNMIDLDEVGFKLMRGESLRAGDSDLSILPRYIKNMARFFLKQNRADLSFC